MDLSSQQQSTDDEESWNWSDSFSRTGIFYIYINQTSLGLMDVIDDVDYYRISPTPGSYKLYVTTDSANGWSPSYQTSLFDIRITDEEGGVLLEDAAGPDPYTRTIDFSSSSFTVDYYLEVRAQNPGDVFYYAATYVPASPSSSLSIAATDASRNEGDSGTTDFTFTVTRSGDSSGASSANWAVSGAAVSGADFVGGALPTGIVSFAAGETSKQIAVPVAGDTAVEPDEAFSVTITAPSGATIATASASGLIVDDDSSRIGTEGADNLIGTDADESIEGLGGDDTLTGGNGDDTLDGGEGVDTAVFAGDFAEFDWSILIGSNASVLTVHHAGRQETDVLSDIELLRFDDASVDVEDLLAGHDTLHALFNARTGQTIYTADLDEMLSWSQDPDILPLSFRIATPLGTDEDVVPVYRVYSSVYDLYLWTASAALRDSILAEPGIGIADQGIAFHAYEDDTSGATMAIHMLWDWNPTATYAPASAPLNILYVDEPLLPFLDRVGDAVDDMGVQFWL